MSEEAGDTGSSEKAGAEGSSDEDEGALVIDEKNERGGTKRKAEESTEVSFKSVSCTQSKKKLCRQFLVEPSVSLTPPQTFCQTSPKRPKDTEAEGDSEVDHNKSNTEAKLNDVAGPKATAPSSQSESKAEAQENAPAGGQLTADKVRYSLY